MTWEIFEAIAEKILSYPEIESVDFAGMGEPTLNPLLPRFIETLSPHAPTYITTNAATLSPSQIERLLEFGLHNVIVSLSGHNASLFNLMSGGLELEKIEPQVRQLIGLGGGKIKVLGNVSVTPQTEPYIEEIKAYLNNLGIQDIFFSKCHNRGGYLVAPQICDTPMPVVENKRCDIFASTLFVAWTGEVLACCHDLEGKGRIGDLVTEDLDVILERKQKIVEDGVGFPMCENCNDMYRFSQDSTPDGAPLSEWIYSLYVGEDARTARLIEVIKQRDSYIHSLEQRNQSLEDENLAYRNGRVMRFLRWIKEIKRSLFSSS